MKTLCFISLYAIISDSLGNKLWGIYMSVTVVPLTF